MSSTETTPALKTPLSNSKSRKLLQLLCEAQTDILDLAAQEKLSFAKLTAWLNDTATQTTLDGMCRLNDLRAQLLISRYRTLAAARLFELAKDDGGGETARKACVDLLNASLALPILQPELPDNDNDAESARPSVSVEEMHRFLAALGQLGAANPPSILVSDANNNETGA